MRDYTPIWLDLKKNKTASVTANRLFHSRIIKAVRKEKWLDTAYRINVQPKMAVITFTIKFSVLTFYLEEKIYQTEIYKYL